MWIVPILAFAVFTACLILSAGQGKANRAGLFFTLAAMSIAALFIIR